MERLTVEELEKMDKNVLSVSEVCRALGISRNTFYTKYKELEKKFPIDRVGRKYIIRKEPLIAFLKAEGHSRYG